MRLLLLLAPAFLLAAPIVVQDNPAIDPSQFRVTTFASGLSFPISMTKLADGSILVGTTIPNNPSFTSGFFAFGAGVGQLLRFTDADANGIADGPGAVVANLGGAVNYVRSIGDIVVVATSGNGSDPNTRDSAINFFRVGANPTDSYTSLGQLGLTTDPASLGSTLAIALQPSAGGSFDVFFTLIGGDHFGNSIGAVTLSGLLSGTIAPGSITRFTATPSAGSIALSTPANVATGVRSSAGIAFDINGSLLLTDNGWEQSTDELHVLTAGALGGSTFLGYPDNYPEYVTNTFIGGLGQQAFVAFQPQGANESKGAADVVVGPSTFPSPLSNGFFLGFHGTWDAVGSSNTQNPVLYVDRTTGAYFPFLPSGQSGMSHPDGLLGASEGLFVADMFTEFDFEPGTGAVYLIAYDPEASAVPEPSSFALLGAVLLVAAAQRRNRIRKIKAAQQRWLQMIKSNDWPAKAPR